MFKKEIKNVSLKGKQPAKQFCFLYLLGYC